jgi:hypothetical protein
VSESLYTKVPSSLELSDSVTRTILVSVALEALDIPLARMILVPYEEKDSVSSALRMLVVKEFSDYLLSENA